MAKCGCSKGTSVVVETPKVVVRELGKSKPASFYDQSYFDGTGGEKGYPGPYTPACAPWPRAARAIVRAFGNLGITDAIEFGCAMGFLLKFLAEYGWNVKGYDWSEYAVNHAIHGVDVEQGNLLDTRRDFGTAGLVICWDTLEHITVADLKKALATLRKATGQILLVQIALADSPSQAHNLMMPDHVTIQTRAWWEEKFCEAGLRYSPFHNLYVTTLRRMAPSVLGRIWADATFVLEKCEGEGHESVTQESSGAVETPEDVGRAVFSVGEAASEEPVEQSEVVEWGRETGGELVLGAVPEPVLPTGETEADGW